MTRWVAGIGYHHRRAGHLAQGNDELVAATLYGIRRDGGQLPPHNPPRAPLLTADIVTIVECARADCNGWADELLECRDSAILMLGFTGAFRLAVSGRGGSRRTSCQLIHANTVIGVTAANRRSWSSRNRAR